MTKRGMAVLAVVGLLVAGCGDDDGGGPAPAAPRRCLEAVDGFPDNGTSVLDGCATFDQFLAAVEAGGQELTPGEAAIALRVLCQERAPEGDAWTTAGPLCTQVAAVFAATGTPR